MKKLIALILTLCMLVCCTSALAATIGLSLMIDLLPIPSVIPADTTERMLLATVLVMAASMLILLIVSTQGGAA
mgnify:CR=1 FL=1